MIRKIIGVGTAIALVGVFTLVLFRRRPWSTFWYTAGGAFIIAKVVLPYLKKKRIS